MDMDEYQDIAANFASYGGDRLDYAVMGLAEEAGEVAGKAAKFIRRTGCDANLLPMDPDASRAVALELGDVLWMAASVARHLGVRLSDVASANIEKLNGRAARGTIVGEGDER